jgi:hypothetical protein
MKGTNYQMIKLIMQILIAVTVGLIAIFQLTPPVFTQPIFMIVIIGMTLSVGLHFTDHNDSTKQKIREQNLQNKIETLQNTTTSIAKNIGDIIIKTKENPDEQWHQINMIEVAPWFGGEVIDYIFLLFKTETGIITGKFRIQGSENIHPFSTQVNTTLPLPVKNRWLPERGHFQKMPTMEYMIVEKSNFNATLNIIMSHAHGVGELGVITLDKPVEMVKRK